MLLELRQEKRLNSNSRFFQIKRSGRPVRNNKMLWVKLKINADMITKMLDFIAQRKVLWVFREPACDLTAGHFRR